MRMLRKNKRRLMYSLLIDSKSDYDVDSKGMMKSGSIGGVDVPMRTGFDIGEYSDPVEFWGHIAYSKSEAGSEPFGISVENYDAELVMCKGEIPIDETSLLFVDSEPEYEFGKLYPGSADYEVAGITSSLNHVRYFLRRIVK